MTLFHRFFKKLPDDELFQRYLEVPLLPRNGQDVPPRSRGDNPPPFSRIFQFVQDMTGRPDFGAILLLHPTAGQLMDGKAILEAHAPEETGTELAQSFLSRMTQRLEKVDKQHPVG